MTKCYLKECEKEVYPESYWCTRTHQLAWQEENYNSSNHPQKDIQKIQARLKEMGQEARKKQHAV